MFTIIVNRDSTGSISTIVVDDEMYAPRGQNIRVRAGLVSVKYTSDTGKTLLSVMSSSDRTVFLTCQDSGQLMPVHELLLEQNRLYHVQAWAKIGD